MGRNSVKKLNRPPRHSRGPAVVRMESEEALFAEMEQVPSPLLLVLEALQDPHNLGACLRTASGAGVLAVIAPRKNACGMTDAVRDIACGGAEDVPFLRVKNLGQFMRGLSARGVRTVGTSDRGDQSLYDTDLAGPTALVLGSEGWGLRKGTAGNCDQLVRIPMRGRTVDCLNVSVSAGVCLYEAVRQRMAAGDGG